MLISKRAIGGLLVAIASSVTALLLTSCLPQPTPEQRTAKSVLESVSVDGFREVYEQRRGSTVTQGMVGPVRADVFEVISAPDWEPEPYPAELPDSDPVFEHVVRSAVEGHEPLICIITVRRLRDGVEPPRYDGLTEEDSGEIRAGNSTLLEVAATCLPRA